MIKEGGKSLKDFKSDSISPFVVEGVELRRYMIRKGEREVFDKNTGELSIMMPLNQDGAVMSDTLEFRKVYAKSFSSFKELSVPGLKLLIFILDLMKKDSTMVSFDNQSAMDFCGYSTKKMIYIGLIDLLENKFIARSIGEGNYHININYIFNGKRTNLQLK